MCMTFSIFFFWGGGGKAGGGAPNSSLAQGVILDCYSTGFYFCTRLASISFNLYFDNKVIICGILKL